MDKERFIQLLTKKKSNAISLPEQKELAEFLHQYPEYSETAKIVDDFYEESLHTATNSDVDKHWQSLLHKMQGSKGSVLHNKEKKIFYFRKIWAAAALLILLVGASFFLYNRGSVHPGQQNTIVTRLGSKSGLTLPDGSEVWLNADSKIEYSRDFGKDTREVTLTGEAYFDVAKDSLRPFIVRTAFMDVKVLGTAFNIRAYKNEINSQATLVRGAVEVDLKNRGGKTIFLKPNEKIVVKNNSDNNAENAGKQNSGEPEIVVTKVSVLSDEVPAEALWIKNKLAFDQMRFEDIALELERWYGVKINIHNEKLKGKTFSGVFENKSIDEVISALQVAAKFQYTNKNNTIEIQ